MLLIGTPFRKDVLVHHRAAIRAEANRHYGASMIVVGATLS
jgi:hypothetical protein